ncbi:hypothetical protein D3C71_2064170 [compost metagenome]
MVSRTCVHSGFSAMAGPPWKLARKMSALKAITMATIATSSGTTFAMVTTVLISVACSTPRSISR